ncbi:hypothetical protein SAMN02745129_2397 [Ferrimonas marina]|uniref:Uncharacterized protein n=1 Tax=Ferrimonas marina TaxID=299255 RepID=A0A1M5U3F4_9GAMM|nr:hypothetical protein SAMN02745129_2397 [Ferrimonas marina]
MGDQSVFPGRAAKDFRFLLMTLANAGRPNKRHRNDSALALFQNTATVWQESITSQHMGGFTRPVIAGLAFSQSCWLSAP